MAAIYQQPLQQQQVPVQQAPAQDNTFQLAQRPAGSTGQDPLFDALVKYITSGPGPSSVTSGKIQEIIDTHRNENGGRAYLESIVASDVEKMPRIWMDEREVKGFVSTNLGSLTLVFETVAAGFSLLRIDFRGSSPGFFRRQHMEFKGRLYWDNISNGMAVRTETTYQSATNLLDVEFYDDANKQIGVLHINGLAVNLPPYPVTGQGVFSRAD